jgi:hypothetical protein
MDEVFSKDNVVAFIPSVSTAMPRIAVIDQQAVPAGLMG